MQFSGAFARVGSQPAVDCAGALPEPRTPVARMKTSLAFKATRDLKLVYYTVFCRSFASRSEEEERERRARQSFSPNTPVVIPCGKFNHRLEKLLGKGTSSDVYEDSISMNNGASCGVFAIKESKPNLASYLSQYKEFTFTNYLNRLDLKHETCIIRPIEIFYKGTRNYIVSPLFPRTLYSYLHTLRGGCSLRKVRALAKAVLPTLSFLRKNRIVHADIKPQNFLFKPFFTVCLIDFGGCFQLNGPEAQDFLQTSWYRAPEVAANIQPYGCAIDMWSFGCLLIECYTGKPPFDIVTEFVDLEKEKALPQDERDRLEDVRNTRENESLLLKQSALLGNEWPQMYKEKSALFQSDSFCKKMQSIEMQPSLFERLIRKNMRNGIDEEEELFIDLIKGMLHYDPKQRSTPKQAMGHPFMNQNGSVEAVIADNSGRRGIRPPPLQASQHSIAIEDETKSKT